MKIRLTLGTKPWQKKHNHQRRDPYIHIIDQKLLPHKDSKLDKPVDDDLDHPFDPPSGSQAIHPVPVFSKANPAKQGLEKQKKQLQKQKQQVQDRIDQIETTLQDLPE